MASEFRVKNANIQWTNFSGKPNQWDPEKKERYFHLIIEDQELLDRLNAEGWNVKPWQPKLEDGRPDPDRDTVWHLPVFVRFDVLPPYVLQCTPDYKNVLDEHTIGILDTVTINDADIAVRARFYNQAGREGIKAYLSAMVVQIEPSHVSDMLAEYNDMGITE